MSKTKRKRSTLIGIIAEDESDFNCARELIIKLCPGRTLAFKKNLGRGAGIIPSKCHKWSKVLRDKGCQKLIILLDSDGKDPSILSNDIKKSLHPSPINDNVIVVAVQELENWLLADLESIHKTFSLKKTAPKELSNPEKIKNAKEYLYSFVLKNYNKPYMHTVHNTRIASVINIEKIKSKCPSFKDLENFASAI